MLQKHKHIFYGPQLAQTCAICHVRQCTMLQRNKKREVVQCPEPAMKGQNYCATHDIRKWKGAA